MFAINLLNRTSVAYRKKSWGVFSDLTFFSCLLHTDYNRFNKHFICRTLDLLLNSFEVHH